MNTPDAAFTRPVVKMTLLAASTLTVMAGGLISPALPSIRSAFANAPDADLLVRLVLTLPGFFIALSAPFAGYLVDRLGRRRVLIASALLYGLAGVTGLVADDLILLLVGRAVLGVAVAGLMTAVTALITDYYTGRARAQFIGLQAAIMGASGTFFLSIGGLLAEQSWRTPFLLYSVVFILLPLIITRLPEVVRGDPASAGAASPAVTFADAPLHLMALAYPAVVAVQIGFYLVLTQLPFYLETQFGSGASSSGFIISAMPLFFSLTAGLYGWFSRRVSPLTLLTFGFAVTGAGLILIGPAQSLPLIVVGLALGGVGNGLIMPNLNTWLADQSPALLRGRVLSGFTMAVFFGQFISPVVTQPLVDQVGVRATFVDAGLVSVGFGVIIWLLRKWLLLLVVARPNPASA